MKGERLVAVGTSNGEHFEDEFDMLHSQIFGQSNQKVAGNFKDLSPEEQSDLLRNSIVPSLEEHHNPALIDNYLRNEGGSMRVFPVPGNRSGYSTEENAQRDKEAKPLQDYLNNLPPDIERLDVHEFPPDVGDVKDYPPGAEHPHNSIILRSKGKPPLVGQNEDTKLFFVRHGETEENEEDLIREKDSRLTDKGRKQAETAARQLKSEGVNAIVSSNLPRAKESAHIIAAKLGIVPQFDDRLNTWDVGSLEGKPCSEGEPVMRKLAEKEQDTPAPGGESFNDFKDRAFAGIRDAINTNKDKKLAILTHSKVEGALKAWNATGQDNPELDYKKVNQQGDAPGSVEPFTMKANSTIMQGETDFSKEPMMGLRQDEFEGRFRGETQPFPKNVPTFNQRFEGEPTQLYTNIEGYDPNKAPLNWWKRESVTPFPDYKIRRLLDERGRDITGNEPTEFPSTSKDAQFTPVGDYKPFPPSQEKSIEDLAAKHQIEGSKLKEILKDVLLHPGDYIQPSPGGITISGVLRRPAALGTIKEMLSKGASLNDIADRFNTTRNVIAGVLNREGLKTKNVLRGREPKEEAKPYSPEISGSQGDKDYEKALSDWMKNQFEGGPIDWMDSIKGSDNELKLLQQRQRQIQYDKKLSGTQDEPSGELSKIKERLKELK